MPDFKFSLSAKPPKPKPKKPGKIVVVRAGGRGGSGNISRTKILATQSSSNSLIQIKSTNTTATAATAGSRATSYNSRTGSSRTGSSAKSLSSLREEHPDYGCSIASPAGREVALPRNKTTTSGRGGLGNAHDHVLEKGVFERVLAHEDAVIRQREMKATRSTGRGGSGNIKRSKGDKYGPSSKGSLLTQSVRSRGISTKSSETKSQELSRFETQISMQTTDTNGVPLSTSSFSDQIPESPQEEEGTETNDDEVEKAEVVLGRMVAKVAAVSQRNFSRPTQPEVLEARVSSGLRRSHFRPSPESWANATTEALALLKATGVISQVPEVPKVPKIPQSVQTLSLPNTGITSPSPEPFSQVPDAHVEISADSHFKRVAPGVSLYSPGPSEQTGLTPLSQQFESQQSSKPVRTPSDRSTELPYLRTREKGQTRQKRNVAMPISSSDYVARHEEPDDPKPAPPRAPSRSYWAEDSPGRSTSRPIDPLGDPPQYAAQSPPIPGFIAGVSPYTSHPPATHEKHETRTSDETVLNLSSYSFPDTPSHRLVHIPPAPQHSPQDRRKVVTVEGDVPQPRWDSERRRDDYPLNPPPYGTAQFPGRTPINPGALYQSQRHRAERDFPGAPRDDLWADGMSSSPTPVSRPSPHRSQDPRASPAPWGRPGEHRSFLPSPLCSQPRPISPGIDPTRLQNYRDNSTADRRPSAIAEDVPQGHQPPGTGPPAGLDRKPSAEHLGHCHLRRVRSRHRNLSAGSGPPRDLPTQPLPSIPSSHCPDERGFRYQGNSEPRHFSSSEDLYSSNYGSHPYAHSSITTVVSPSDGTSAAESTVRSLSRLSTIDDSHDELHNRKVNFASVRAHRTRDNHAFYSDVLGEYQHEGDVAPHQVPLKCPERATVEALRSAGPGTPNPNLPSKLTNITTAVFEKEVNITPIPQTVASRPTRSLRMPNTENEAPLHGDELNIPSCKPLSRMEKALLRRVEFGSYVDHSKLWLA